VFKRCLLGDEECAIHVMGHGATVLRGRRSAAVGGERRLRA
jgi:hypothetical protein